MDGTQLDRAACRQVRRSAMAEAIKRRPWIRFAHPVMTLIALVFGLAIGWLLGSVLDAWLPSDVVGWRRLLPVLAIAIPVMLLVWLAFAMMNRLLLERHMRSAMRDIGYELCPTCGYWLRGLDPATTQCPECGAARS